MTSPAKHDRDTELGLTGRVLLSDLDALVARWVLLTEVERWVVVLWIAHTHAFEAAETTPYLSITSAEKESGKTRLLEVLERLVAKPWLTGRTTVAALVRKVDTQCPTLLLDESDTAFHREREYSEALRGILNTGYARSGRATLCVPKGNKFEVQEFQTFCPKAIAGIGRLPDTVESRSIPIRMRRRRSNEQVQRLRRRSAHQLCEPVRERASSWGQTAAPALTGVEPSMPDELGDRAADVLEPLVAIADLAGGPWPERARTAARELLGSRPRDDDSLGATLLEDIRGIFDELGIDTLPSGQLVSRLLRIEESPWADINGRPLNVNGLARRLRPFEISPSHWRQGATTHRGYHLSDFEDAFARYLPADPPADRHTRHADPEKEAEISTRPAHDTTACQPASPSTTASDANVSDVPIGAGVPQAEAPPSPQEGQTGDREDHGLRLF